jgi:hypothetical protein
MLCYSLLIPFVASLDKRPHSADLRCQLTAHRCVSFDPDRHSPPKLVQACADSATRASERHSQHWPSLRRSGCGAHTRSRRAQHGANHRA